MIRSICASLLVSALVPALSLSAAAEDDTIVRLPGSGEVKSESDKSRLNMDRLKPGGGLLASFDTNEDGRVSDAEMKAGIQRAFVDADENKDGTLTAIEQQKWAEGLPTRDNSLANPVRFDPNLDRRVSYSEFSSVITDLGEDYRGDGQAELRIASLRATKSRTEERRDERRDEAVEEVMRNPDAPTSRREW